MCVYFFFSFHERDMFARCSLRLYFSSLSTTYLSHLFIRCLSVCLLLMLFFFFYAYVLFLGHVMAAAQLCTLSLSHFTPLRFLSLFFEAPHCVSTALKSARNGIGDVRRLQLRAPLSVGLIQHTA